jgi:hypothetical protein
LKGRGCTFLRYPYVSQLLWSIILIRETEGGGEEMSSEKEGLKTSISIMSVNSCLEFLHPAQQKGRDKRWERSPEGDTYTLDIHIY